MAAFHSLKDVHVVWGASPAVGISKDGGVSIEFNEDFTELHISGDGVSNTMTQKLDRSAQITVSISKSSITNATWGIQLAAQEAGTPAPALFIRDENTGATFTAEQARCMKAPTFTYGESVTEVEWVLVTDRLVAVQGDPALIETSTP